MTGPAARPFRTSRGDGFRRAGGEVIGSGRGTHDLILCMAEPMTSGPGSGGALTALETG